MAMKLNFWVADGPNGEACDKEVRLKGAWEIYHQVDENLKYTRYVAVTLEHTSRQRGEYLVWVHPTYRSGTFGGCKLGEIVPLKAKG